MSSVTRGWVTGSLLAGALALSNGCSDGDTVSFDFDFTLGAADWVGGFADYPAGQDGQFDLVADYRPLGPPLDTSGSALYIAGTNRSDDLWMYYKSEVALAPETGYRVRFDVQIATIAASGCVGVGGAPGEDVTVKAGVSLIEPDRELDSAGWWRMNVDKGSQTESGEDSVVIGDLANSRSCDEEPEWELKGLSGPSMVLTTDGDGRAWLFVGTDSGFEARSAVYYTRFRADFEPM